MEVKEGFPGRRRNVLAAIRSVRRIFQADESVYNSLIMANINSRAIRVSSSVKGVGSVRRFCALTPNSAVPVDIEEFLGNRVGESLLVEVLDFVSFLERAAGEAAPRMP